MIEFSSEPRLAITKANFAGFVIGYLLHPQRFSKINRRFISYFFWSHDKFITSFSLMRLISLYFLAPPLPGEDKTELQQHLVELLCRWINVQFVSLRDNAQWVDAFGKFMDHLKKGSDTGGVEIKDVRLPPFPLILIPP